MRVRNILESWATNFKLSTMLVLISLETLGRYVMA